MKRRKKRWADLSPKQRRLIVAAGVAQYSLLAAALIDLKRRPAEQVKGDKRLWAVASCASFLGSIGYLVFGRKR
jgi:hypothetical protein